MSDAAAVLASLGAASKGAKFEPMNLKAKFEDRAPVSNAYRVVALPIWGWIKEAQRDPRTPYRVGAQSWDDYLQTDGVNPIVFFLQFFMLFEEYSHLIGGSDCLLDPDTSPEDYHEVCRTAARLLVGSKPPPTATQIEKKKKAVVMNDRVDLRYAYDVAWEKRVLEHEDKVKKQKEAKGKKASARNRMRKMRRKRKAAAPVKTPVQLYAEWFEELGIEYMHYGVHGDEFQSEPVERVQEQEEEEEEEEEQRGEDEAEEEGAEEGGVEVEPLGEKPKYEGPRRMDKVSMTITEIPHARNPDEIMGLMVWFVFHDYNADPGFFYRRMVQNLRNRDTRSKTIGMGVRGAEEPEMFSAYESYMLSYHPAGKHTTLETYARCIQILNPDYVGAHYSGNMGMFLSDLDPTTNSKAHVFNLLTPEFAIQCLKDAGGDPDVLGTAAQWINRDDGVLKFPQSVRTWKPMHAHVFWDNPKLSGFVRHYFPHVDMRSDFLRSLTSGMDMQAFLDGASPDATQAYSKLEKMLTDDIRHFNADLDEGRDLGYTTSNEFVYKAKQTSEIYHHINQHFPSRHAQQTMLEAQELQRLHSVRWRQYLTHDQMRRVEELELYNVVLNTAQEALTKQFCSLIQLEKDPSSLPVSEPIRAMIKWYQNVHATKLPHMTREYVTIDPNLDPFGNTQIRQLYIYTHYAKILQPMICLLSEGLFSCYDAFMDELSYHMMIHGRYEIGKTWTGIRTLTKFTTIPGTVSEYSLATKAADTTQKHSYDEIVATDECPEWIVNENEAKKHPEQVNKEKVKMTRGQLVQRTFAFVELPSGRKVRWNEDITTDHKKACVFISNGTAESKRALSSRMHRLIMKQCEISPNDMKGYVGETAMKDAQMWLHINQFTSALSKKLAACGGILPDVEMQLFEDVSSRVIKFLQQQNAVPADVGGTRSLEIIKSYLRQLIYKMAIRYTYDFPWSKHYKKKFHPEQLRDIQPFLYVTVEMIFWVWTACASEWVNDDYCNVLQAMLKEAGVVWGRDDTPYNLFENDLEGRIKFKTYEDKFFNSNDNHDLHDKHLVDLNYLVLEGTEDSIAQKVAQHTMPKMEPEQIKGVFKRLSEMQKVPTSGGYRPVRKGALELWHRYRGDGTKQTGVKCPADFLHANPNMADPRTEGDMPFLPEGATLAIVDRSDLAKKKLYFMPGFADSFRQDIILDALMHATVCRTTRPGKILLGFTNRENPSRLDVHNMTESDISSFITALDEDTGFYYDEDNNWVNDDPDVTSRRQGIVFNRAAALSETDVRIETTAPLAPKPEGDETWKHKYTEDAAAMSKTHEVVEDLNADSALRQHLRCGRPLDEPVRTPQWIAAQNALHRVPNNQVDYPHDEINKRGVMEKKWRKSVITTHRTASLLSDYRERGKRSMADRAAEALQQEPRRAPAAVIASSRKRLDPPPRAPRSNTQGGIRKRPAVQQEQHDQEQEPPRTFDARALAVALSNSNSNK